MRASRATDGSGRQPIALPICIALRQNIAAAIFPGWPCGPVLPTERATELVSRFSRDLVVID